MPDRRAGVGSAARSGDGGNNGSAETAADVLRACSVFAVGTSNPAGAGADSAISRSARAAPEVPVAEPPTVGGDGGTDGLDANGSTAL